MMQANPDPESNRRKAAFEVVRPLLGERFGFLFAKLHQRWSVETIADLRAAGIGLSGTHYGCLAIVREAGPMSQQKLGELVDKDRTTIVAIIDELEGEGLIERRRNPSDRRAYALEVTRHGEDWLERARPVLQGCEERLLATLDAGERAALRELLNRVIFEPPPVPR